MVWVVVRRRTSSASANNSPCCTSVASTVNTSGSHRMGPTCCSSTSLLRCPSWPRCCGGGQLTMPAVRHAQRQFFADFAGSRAAERLPGTGLRLLHAEHCVFERALELKASQQPLPASLPASLQILSLVNLGRGQQLEPVEGEGWVDVGHPIRREATWNLLEPCTALRELYILGTRFWNTSACNFLDLPRIATSCPVLQVLVLHAVMDTGQEVRPTPADLSLASLLPSFAVWLDVVPRGCAGRSIWQRRVCAARTGSPRDHQVQHGA